jgi:hypothetical protein
MIYSIQQTLYHLIANLTIQLFPLYAGYGHSWSKFVGCVEYLRTVVSISLIVFVFLIVALSLSIGFMPMCIKTRDIHIEAI